MWTLEAMITAGKKASAFRNDKDAAFAEAVAAMALDNASIVAERVGAYTAQDEILGLKDALGQQDQETPRTVKSALKRKVIRFLAVI